MFTKEQKESYVSSGGHTCPVCKSENLEGGSFDVDSGECWQEIACLDCDLVYYDVYYDCYKLNDIEKKE